MNTALQFSALPKTYANSNLPRFGSSESNGNNALRSAADSFEASADTLDDVTSDQAKKGNFFAKVFKPLIWLIKMPVKLLQNIFNTVFRRNKNKAERPDEF